ncbi:MAG: hypothetical protein AAFR58_01855 [Cyanobacteria bacterium J06627_28]
MVRGLLWLPLLVVFFGLAWAGWNEYRKVEVYKVWATQFERAKYDIYAVLGQKGDRLTWGLPTRKGVIDTNELNLLEVKGLAIEVNNQPIDPADLPTKGRFALGFTTKDERHLSIPFTDGDITQRWFEFIRQTWAL